MRSATKASRKAVLLIVLFGVTLATGSATPAKAACSWILWGSVIDGQGIRELSPKHWTIEQSFESKGECSRELAKLSRPGKGDDMITLKETSAHWINTNTDRILVYDYRCIPDTIDLREPKR